MAWAGSVAGLTSNRQAQVLCRPLSPTRANPRPPAPLPVRTKFEAFQVCSEWLQETGSKPANEALFDDDFGTFWESDEGNRKGPPAPWVIIRFSQADELEHVAIRINPADEKDDALAESVELLAGARPELKVLHVSSLGFAKVITVFWG
eukprot:SAG31_NODE_2056_length_6546_cov_1.979060_7_plen_149_part_00